MAVHYNPILISFFSVAILFSGLLSSVFAAQNYYLTQADYMIVGLSENDQIGLAARGIGDVNGDCFIDLAIDRRLHGKHYLFFGLPSSWSRTMDLNDAHVIIQGESDTFGNYWLYGAAFAYGDVNGDGINDLLIGDGGYSSSDYRAGKAYIFFGKQRQWKPLTFAKEADTSYIGKERFDTVGGAIEPTGDINGDGYDDFAIGCFFKEDTSFDSSNANIWVGKTYFCFGKSSSWTTNIDIETSDVSFWGFYDSDDYGSYISSVGDVDRDGYDDVLISYTTYYGKCEYGYQDINCSEGHGGGAHLVYGRQSPWYRNLRYKSESSVFTGEGPPTPAVYPTPSDMGDQAGRSLSTIGDINGDGYSDFIIGANFNDQNGKNAGKVYLYLGRPQRWPQESSLAQADAYFLGENPDDLLGQDAAGLGDINGDGFDDFIFSAAANDWNGPSSGICYLFLGKQTGWSGFLNVNDADVIFIGEAADNWAGDGLAYLGDIDGDYYDDILIAANGNSDVALHSGKVYIITSLFHNTKPSTISYVSLKSDQTYTGDRTQPVSFGEDLFIEVTGRDADLNCANTTEVIVSTNKKPHGIKVRCIETGPNTGVFRRSIWITDKGSNFMCRRIGAYPNDWLTITSRQDANISVTYPIRNPTPTPRPTPTPNPGPRILLGGYWDTTPDWYDYRWYSVFLTGHLKEGWSERLELYYQGAGPILSWNGYGDDLFFIKRWLPGLREHQFRGTLLPEFIVWDYDGVPSNTWPYLTVE